MTRKKWVQSGNSIQRRKKGKRAERKAGHEVESGVFFKKDERSKTNAEYKALTGHN